MRIFTWNVNGLRACIKNGFMDSIKNLDMDILCLQETKLQPNQIPVEIVSVENYLKHRNIEKVEKKLDLDLKTNFMEIDTNDKKKSFWHFSIKKGYSGVATISKSNPITYRFGLGVDEFDAEGRCITLEYEDFYLVNCYVPNARQGLVRIDFRTKWENAILAHLQNLDKIKPVVYCGDLNVAHNEIDLKNAKQNVGEPGFSDEERQCFTDLLNAGFTDVFRKMYADTIKYSWWSYRGNARENNVGWRIDYFVVSNRFFDKIKNIIIHDEIMGSDHCPVELVL